MYNLDEKIYELFWKLLSDYKYFVGNTGGSMIFKINDIEIEMDSIKLEKDDLSKCKNKLSTLTKKKAFTVGFWSIYKGVGENDNVITLWFNGHKYYITNLSRADMAKVLDTLEEFIQRKETDTIEGLLKA